VTMVSRKYAFAGDETWQGALRAGLAVQRANLQRAGRSARVSVYRRDGRWWATWGHGLLVVDLESGRPVRVDPGWRWAS
jgi:hypothetical protein